MMTQKFREKCLYLSILLAPVFGGCMLTDALELTPRGAVPAAAVKDRLQTEAGLGFVLGCEYYLARKNGVDFDCRNLSTFQASAAVAFFMAPVFAQVDDSRYYRSASVEACAERVFGQAFLFTFGYLQHKQKTTGRPDLALPATADEYKTAAAFAAYGATDCGLERTGKLVELGGALSL